MYTLRVTTKFLPAFICVPKEFPRSCIFSSLKFYIKTAPKILAVPGGSDYRSQHFAISQLTLQHYMERRHRRSCYFICSDSRLDRCLTTLMNPIALCSRDPYNDVCHICLSKNVNGFLHAKFCCLFSPFYFSMLLCTQTYGE